MSVYVVVANEAERVAECAVFEDYETAMAVFEAFCAVWGRSNVCFASRKVGDIPPWAVGRIGSGGDLGRPVQN